MKKIFIGFGVLIILVIGALLIIPAFIPVDVYKREIIAGIEDATGRKARIDGDFKLGLFPRVEFVAGKVSLANAPKGQVKNMLTLDRLTVRVAVMPLLSGNLEVDTLVVDKPVINLEVNRAGKPNWQFAAAGKSAPAKSGGSAGLSGIKLGDVRLVDGRVSYIDKKSGTTQKLGGINLKVALPSLSSPMRAEGSIIWNKEEINLTAMLSNPNAFLAGKATNVETSIKSNPVKLSFKGKVTNGKVATVRGNIDLDVPSVRKLAAWTGSPLKAPGTGLGPLKISGNLDMKGKVIAFRKAKLALDAITGEGNISIDQRRKKPVIKAALKLSNLDLNPYLPPEKKTPAKPAAAGKAGPGDWSDDPIDLSALNSADATLDLSVGGLVMRKIKIGQSVLKVTLKNGVLVTDLTKMALYKGVGKAKVTTRAGRGSNTISLNATLSNFQANPFMRDAMDFDRIEGTANSIISITTRGSTQRQLVSALGGKGKVTFLNGAIKGVNLGSMVRNVKSAFLDSGASKAQKTDFSEMGGTFTINRGIVTNKDLLMKSPLLRLTGKGTVDLPKRRVDYRLEPKVVASSKGQGGATSAGGISVPVNVKGPWHNISYTPDLSAMLGNIAKQPEKALESVKGLIPGTGGSGSSTTKEPSSSPVDSIKGLFGR
jgi:AsmA protein